MDATVCFIPHINYVQKEKMGTYIRPLNYIHFFPSSKLILVLHAVPSEPTYTISYLDFYFIIVTRVAKSIITAVTTGLHLLPFELNYIFFPIQMQRKGNNLIHFRLTSE